MDQRKTDEIIASLNASVDSLRRTTWRIGLVCVRSEKDFNKLLISIKKMDGEISKEFIDLAMSKKPQYESLLKMFIIFD